MWLDWETQTGSSRFIAFPISLLATYSGLLSSQSRKGALHPEFQQQFESWASWVQLESCSLCWTSQCGLQFASCKLARSRARSLLCVQCPQTTQRRMPFPEERPRCSDLRRECEWQVPKAAVLSLLLLPCLSSHFIHTTSSEELKPGSEPRSSHCFPV